MPEKDFGGLGGRNPKSGLVRLALTDASTPDGWAKVPLFRKGRRPMRTMRRSIRSRGGWRLGPGERSPAGFVVMAITSELE